jgi:hypothetical protein
MRRWTALASISALIFAAGCMPSVPKRSDPLAAFGFKSGNSALKRARLALLLSENTKKSAEYLRKVRDKGAAWGARFDDQVAARGINDVLRGSFGDVQAVDSPESAASSGANMIAVLDMYAKVGTVSFTKSVTELTVDFRTLKMEPIAVVGGHGRRMVPYPAMTNNWEPAAQDAIDAFALALSTNAELAAFVAQLPALAPAAPSLAGAPVAPVPAKTYLSDVETPAFRFPEDGSKFALIVGVEKYASLPSADHAARDARAMKAHLLAAGYPERNIVLLMDQQAGKSGLEKYLDAWLPKNTDENSSVLFYFSGHGAPNPDDQQAYLVPWDGDPKFLENTAYPVQRLYERLNALKAKRVLVAMDACFSGTGGRSVIAKGTRPLVAKVDAGANTAGRVQALTASASDEVTGAEEEAGHGLFTYHLLKGLSAMGGKATFKELYDYLTPKVRDAARRDNRDQTPQLIGSGAARL